MTLKTFDLNRFVFTRFGVEADFFLEMKGRLSPSYGEPRLKFAVVVPVPFFQQNSPLLERELSDMLFSRD